MTVENIGFGVMKKQKNAPPKRRANPALMLLLME